CRRRAGSGSRSAPEPGLSGHVPLSSPYSSSPILPLRRHSLHDPKIRHVVQPAKTQRGPLVEDVVVPLSLRVPRAFEQSLLPRVSHVPLLMRDAELRVMRDPMPAVIVRGAV